LSSTEKGNGIAGGDALSLARALVRIPSVNPALEEGGTAEREAARAAAGWLAGWGFESRLQEVAPGRFNVVARHPPSSTHTAGPTLLFNGHLDTVGVQGMTIPPFEGRVDGDRLLGRGSCDMKGGVAALLSASAALARRGHRGSVIVALTRRTRSTLRSGCRV
jgi:acetylornithine deacetylase